MGNVKQLKRTCTHGIRLEAGGPLYVCVYEDGHPGQHESVAKTPVWPFVQYAVCWYGANVRAARN